MDENVWEIKTLRIKTSIRNGDEIHRTLNLVTPQETTKNQAVTQTYRYLRNQLTRSSIYGV